MNENLHNIDKLFKTAIEDHEELPSTDVWNNIDKGLDKKNVVSIQRKYYVLKRVAVAVFIFGFVASVFAIYYNGRYKNSPSQTGIRAVNEQTTVKTKDKPSEGTQNNITDKRNESKEDLSSSKPNESTSTNTKVVNVATSFSSSNSNATALSSVDYNKINGEQISSSHAIVAADNKKRELMIKNQITTDPNQSAKNDALNNFQDRINKNITVDHLLYSFQPAFTKSFNRSDIAPVSSPPITKLKKLPHIAVTVFAGPQKNILHLKDAPNQGGQATGMSSGV